MGTSRELGSKSDLFPMRVGLRQDYTMSPILFVIFMDRISGRGWEKLQFMDG